MASVCIFASCEKEDGKISKFVAPMWVLVDSNYCDEDGNCGSLYRNANNENETLFEVTLRSKKKCEDEVLWGTWHEIKNEDGVVVGSWCNLTDLSVRNCYTKMYYDKNCNLIAVQQVHIMD